MQATISKTWANYYIDGEKYAEIEYEEDDVPQEGYFGFAVYNRDNLVIVNNIYI